MNIEVITAQCKCLANVQKLTYFTLRIQDDLEGNREAVTAVLNSTSEPGIPHKNAAQNNWYLLHLSVYNTVVGVSEVYTGFHGYSRV